MYIKAMLVAGVAYCGSSLWAFSPVITETKTDQDEKTGAVTVTYKLTGEDAVITADVQTNSAQSKAWASIGPANYTGMTGDVWKIISAGDMTRTITWTATADGEKLPKFDKHVRVVLTAWSLKAPPDWFVIDLSKEEPPAYYTDEKLLPVGGSVTNRVYKDRYLVMKRIHAAGITWSMGINEFVRATVTTEAAAYSKTATFPDQPAHPVMLTHDYYIAVFEMTEAQHYRITGVQPYYANVPRKPVDCVNFASLRGTNLGIRYPVITDGKFDYDESAKVDDGSFIAQLRANAGNRYLFDLPTCAQMEFAAGAGSRSGLPDNITHTEANVKAIGRCTRNNAGADCEGNTYYKSTVGSYTPNGFGLYDMIGNIMEPSLDRSGAIYPTDVVTVDPIGNTDPSVTTRVYPTGGGWDYYTWSIGLGRDMAIAYDTTRTRSTRSATYYGYRVALTLR